MTMAPSVEKAPEMKIELTVVEDLGIKLYGTLPPVISELVANAWDADASEVKISVDEGEVDEATTIVVTDNGEGMSYDDIVDKYLRVGRKRRDEERETTPNNRLIMGRKGIGKLSVFGIAATSEIKTVRNGCLNAIRMNVNDMIKEAKDSGTYKPTVIHYNSDTSENQGTTIILSGFKRKTKMGAQSIRRKIARHFSVIGDGFRVSVNDHDILSSDKLTESDMDEIWKIQEYVDPGVRNWPISGWVGATEEPLDEEDRGITITARGKLIQSPTLFDIKSGDKFYYSYITGEINAEFFDTAEDLISTNRQSVIWDTPQGELLKRWGHSKLKELSNSIAEKRRQKNEKVLMEDPELESWRNGLNRQERNQADRIIRILTSKEKMNAARRKEIMRHVITVFEQKVFLDLLAQLEDEEDPAMLLDVFEQWDVVEAREIERIVSGRLKTIDRLKNHIREDSKEVPTLHKYFRKWPWILEPTWTKWNDEVYFSQLLRERFPERKLKEKNRRIDFIAIGTGDTINVVELKRPGHTVSRRDVNQLVDYVAFVNDHLGNDSERGYNSVAGYIVGGKISSDRAARTVIAEGRGHRRYVRTYADLVTVAQQLHALYEEKLKELKPDRSVSFTPNS